MKENSENELSSRIKQKVSQDRTDKDINKINPDHLMQDGAQSLEDGNLQQAKNLMGMLSVIMTV